MNPVIVADQYGHWNVVLNALTLGTILMTLFVVVRLLVGYRLERSLWHRLITPMATIRGLLHALEAGLEVDGGLTGAQRALIYRRMEEQFARFYDVADPEIAAEIWEKVRERRRAAEAADPEIPPR